jgi:hypothetical protein
MVEVSIMALRATGVAEGVSVSVGVKELVGVGDDVGVSVALGTSVGVSDGTKSSVGKSATGELVSFSATTPRRKLATTRTAISNNL